jgi:hypothetical protein
MPTRSLLLGNTYVLGIQGTECLERMDGRTQSLYMIQSANNIVVLKRSHLLFGQIRNILIGHPHSGSLGTISPRNSSKCISIRA